MCVVERCKTHSVIPLVGFNNNDVSYAFGASREALRKCIDRLYVAILERDSLNPWKQRL